MASSHAQTAVIGGFSDPVFQSQDAFRRIMDAFARPGTISDLGGFADAPEPLSPAAAALLLTLADGDASVFLEGESENGAAAAWIGFQTGAAIVREPSEAALAVLTRRSDPAGWARFALGTDTYPDRSATLVLPVEAFEGGPPLRLSGPGIETEATLAPLGLPAGFLEARRANAGLFPRGRDLVLVAGTALAALPRTTRIEER